MDRIPVTVLCGFLGSGKTTRLNELLRAPHGRRLAVIVNEFGEIGIDGSRLAAADEFVELEGGCLCCAVNADLERTLHRLRDRGGFEHLVIETTGLADPLPVAWVFGREGLADAFRVDAIVTVVDAANLDRALAEAPEAALQIERADLLLVSKLDLVPERELAVTAALRARNPAAPIVPAPRGELPWELLLGVDRPPRDERPTGAVAHGHAPSFGTWAFRTAATLAEGPLEDFLYRLPTGVYRAKGLVRTDGGWVQVNVVGGRVEVEPAERPAAADESRLVFIGPSVEAETLRAACERLVVGPV